MQKIVNFVLFFIDIIEIILSRTEEYLADVILHGFVQTLHSITLQFTWRRHQVNKAGNCIITYKTSCLKYNNITYNNHQKLALVSKTLQQYSKFFCPHIAECLLIILFSDEENSVLKDKSLGGMRTKLII